MNICIILHFEHTNITIYLPKKMINKKKDVTKLKSIPLKTRTSESDVEIKISRFLHVVVVHEPFKGSVNYCLGSA